MFNLRFCTDNKFSSRRFFLSSKLYSDNGHTHTEREKHLKFNLRQNKRVCVEIKWSFIIPIGFNPIRLLWCVKGERKNTFAQWLMITRKSFSPQHTLACKPIVFFLVCFERNFAIISHWSFAHIWKRECRESVRK